MAKDPQPVVSVLTPVTVVEPGAFGEVQVEVKNVGPEVAHYDLSVVPDCVPAPWASIVPPNLKLSPGKSGNARVRFNPPLDTSTPAGRFPFGVKVQPGENVFQRPAVAEADLLVGAIHAVKVRRPTKTAGRFRGKPVMWVENNGTEPISARFEVRDEDEALEGEIFPAKVDLEPGERKELLLKVWPTKTKLFGKKQPLPYQVAYRRHAPGSARIVAGPSEGGEVEQAVDGTFERKPVFSPLLILLGALLVLLLAWLIYEWTRPDPPAPFAPDPPEVNGQAAVEDGVEISFVTTTAGSVQGREIDCTTITDPLPTEVETFPAKEGVATGASRYTMPAAVTDVGRCFELRVIDGSNRPSVWTEPIEVPAGEPLDPPTGLDANDPADVHWDAVEGADRYELVITGLDPIATEQTTVNLVPQALPDGEYEVAVKAFRGEQESALSEAVTLVIGAGAGGDDQQAGGDGGNGGTGGPTTDGGTSTDDDAIPEPEGVWVLIGLPEEAEESINAQQPFAEDAGLVGFEVRRVGVQDEEEGFRLPDGAEEELGPDTADLFTAGVYVMVQDGLPDLETAEEFCENYERLVTEALQRAADGSTDPADQLAAEVPLVPSCSAFEGA